MTVRLTSKCWVTLRKDLFSEIKFHVLADRLSLSPDATLVVLYRLADWFQTHSKYGALKYAPEIVDAVVQLPGLHLALQEIDWLYHEKGVTTLRGFCAVSKIRKAITGKLRASILAPGKCAVCGSTDRLQIDHKIPVSRGGPSTPENLHLLCMSCNRKKGTKTMAEFLRAIKREVAKV